MFICFVFVCLSNVVELYTDNLSELLDCSRGNGLSEHSLISYSSDVQGCRVDVQGIYVDPCQPTWVDWFVSPICLDVVSSARHVPVVCWYRPSDCLLLAAGPFQLWTCLSGTICRIMWLLRPLCQPSASDWKPICSLSPFLTLYRTNRPHLTDNGSSNDLYYLNHFKNCLIDWYSAGEFKPNYIHKKSTRKSAHFSTIPEFRTRSHKIELTGS